jgi:hypothetical protein
MTHNEESTFTPNISKLLGDDFGRGDERLCGFVNVEHGSLEISTRPFYDCAECSSQRTKSSQVTCQLCGRSSDNSVTVLTGSGDGDYPVVDFWPEHFSPFSMVLCDPESIRDYQYIQNQAFAGVTSHRGAGLVLRVDAERMLSELSIGDVAKAGSLKLNTETSVQVSRGGIFMTQLVYADSHRNADLLEGAPVSIPSEVDTYDVYFVSKNLRRTLEEGKRPAIKAIIVCPAAAGEELFGHRYVRQFKEGELFQGSDAWIEGARAGRADAKALMANWNLVMSWGDATSDQSNKFVSRTQAEAYLHQLKAWHDSGNDLMRNQFDGDDYSEGLAMAAEPVELLTSAKLAWLGIGPPTHLDAQNNPLPSADLGLNNEPDASTSELAAFCSACGNKFASVEAKFCAGCGSARL